ncbi:hypothetical protein [Paenibacillus ferrarius]|uniref:DinB/UmuC family translesion DNA polymerase n=1 Tax=Paenibacillus ferrarius TaxID=1469647 RepID=UPI003D287CAE
MTKTNHVYEAVLTLFQKHWDGSSVRKVAVTLSSLISGEQYQLTLFEDRGKLSAIEEVTDLIRDRFGDTAIMRGASITTAGQKQRRSKMIGGHWA